LEFRSVPYSRIVKEVISAYLPSVKKREERKPRLQLKYGIT